MRFLTTKTASHAPDDDVNTMHGKAENISHKVLRLRRVLIAGPDRHATIFFRASPRHLTFEIEVFLTTVVQFALQTMARSFKRFTGIATLHGVRRPHECLLLNGLL